MDKKLKPYICCPVGAAGHALRIETPGGARVHVHHQPK